MKRVFLVRNGEHEFTSKNAWPLDGTGLSCAGRFQSIDIAKEIERLDIATIYSSTKVRAHDTAKPSGRRLGKVVIQQDAFDAVSLGDFEGKTYLKIQERLGDKYDEIFYYPDPEEDNLSTGETLTVVGDRAWNGLADVTRAAREDSSIAVFTHEEIIGVILCKMVETSLSRIWLWGGRDQPPRYGSITELTYAEKRWSLVRFAYMDHLEKI